MQGHLQVTQSFCPLFFGGSFRAWRSFPPWICHLWKTHVWVWSGGRCQSPGGTVFGSAPLTMWLLSLGTVRQNKPKRRRPGQRKLYRRAVQRDGWLMPPWTLRKFSAKHCFKKIILFILFIYLFFFFWIFNQGYEETGKVALWKEETQVFHWPLSLYLAMLRGLQDLSSPWPGIELGASAVKAHSPDHWTTREFSPLSLLKNG